MIKFITFDCYDTLVAYTAGKAAMVHQLVSEKGADTTVAEKVVCQFSQHERRMLASAEFSPLAAVLTRCIEQALRDQNLPFESTDADRIVQAVKDSRPFDDVTQALKELKQHYKLAILSNSQPDIIVHNIAAIDVHFDAVVLAAEVKAYKPDLRMFDALVDRCGCDKSEIVHVAQSFYHDIKPGHAAGLRRVWINRNNLSGDEAFKPYDELPNLDNLFELLGRYI